MKYPWSSGICYFLAGVYQEFKSQLMEGQLDGRSVFLLVTKGLSLTLPRVKPDFSFTFYQLPVSISDLDYSLINQNEYLWFTMMY